MIIDTGAKWLAGYNGLSATVIGLKMKKRSCLALNILKDIGITFHESPGADPIRGFQAALRRVRRGKVWHWAWVSERDRDLPASRFRKTEVSNAKV